MMAEDSEVLDSWEDQVDSGVKFVDQKVITVFMPILNVAL